MNRIALPSFIVALAASFAVAAAPPAAKAPAKPPLPTQDDIRKSVEAKDYEGAIQAITRVLPLKAEAAAKYDRYELFTLKAEAHLQLKQLRSAGDAYAAAAKETKDPERAAVARATQRILRDAKGTRITRRLLKRDGEELQPVSADLLEPEQRAAAYRIAYDDLRAAAEPRIKAAEKARTLKEIEDALKVLADLHDVAIAATGGDAELAATRQDLGQRGNSMIERELERMNKDVLYIRENANVVVKEKIVDSYSLTGANPSSTSVITVRRGLSRDDRKRLEMIMLDCKRAMDTSKSLARSTTGNEDDADVFVERAIEVGRLAQRVLSAKY